MVHDQDKNAKVREMEMSDWSSDVCSSISSSSRVQQLVSRGLLGSVFKDNFDYTSCQLGKQSVLSFNNSESIFNSIFKLIHSNVWGPSPVVSSDGSRYFVCFY